MLALPMGLDFARGLGDGIAMRPTILFSTAKITANPSNLQPPNNNNTIRTWQLQQRPEDPYSPGLQVLERLQGFTLDLVTHQHWPWAMDHGPWTMAMVHVQLHGFPANEEPPSWSRSNTMRALASDTPSPIGCRSLCNPQLRPPAQRSGCSQADTSLHNC